MYQNYKNARDRAWQTLIDCGVDTLPVRLSKIVKYYDSDIKDNADVGILTDNQLGCVAFLDDRYHIVIDMTVSIERQRYTIAHEIGHIALEHTLHEAILMREKFLTFTNSQEYEAERFAMNLLAPACVLWGLDIHKAEDIAKICNISKQSAKKRADRMRTLYKRNMFLSSDLEKQVYQQFKKFIEENK